MPFRALTQMGTFQTSIFHVICFSHAQRQTLKCVNKIYSNEELFESGLYSCSLMALNSDLHTSLGKLNVPKCIVYFILTLLSLLYILVSSLD